MPPITFLRLLPTFLVFVLSSLAFAETEAYDPNAPTFRDMRDTNQRQTDFVIPSENPMTPEKILLGKILFFDPRLSGNNAMSCATCHNPDLGWSDGLPRAIGNGGKVLQRRTPSLFNVALSNRLQWDIEFDRLEDQALAPIRKKNEMNQDLKLLPAEIKAIPGYLPLFEKAFPGEEISTITIARALASFQRTIISGESPFEEFLKGNDNAMSIDAKMGMLLFKGKAGCGLCHFGWKFSDDGAYNIGVKSDDRGIAVSKKDKSMNFMFRNTRLLDVATHPPYMHDGSLPDLAAVVAFYNRGGDIKRPNLSKDMKPRNLTPREEAQLVAFLNSLTSKNSRFERPTLPE